MNLVKTAEQKSKSSINVFHELEIKIFEKLSSDYRFKDILYPIAILDKNERTVFLGSTNNVVGKINYNCALLSALREHVGSIIGDQYIDIEVKLAEKEFQEVKKRIEKIAAKQKKEEQTLAEIESQKNQGKCDLIPFPVKENKVRSDLTVERHAIFAANTFKGNFRAHERKVKDLLSGEDLILRIEVGDRDGQVRGVLKQKHQEAFYKLAQIWAQQNYQLEEVDKEKSIYGSIELSIYDLVQKLKGNDAGQNYKKVLLLLKEMATIRVNIRKINITDNTVDCDDFTLLSYEWYARQFNEKTLLPKPGGISKVRIRFSKFITDNFLKKNVKSLMLSPYFGLKDNGGKGIAQLLYTMLDYELSTKDNFHISLINLSKRLGLTQYRYKSDRKRKLEAAIKAINGQVVLDGKYKMNVYLEESEDIKDWNLIARKTIIPK